MEAGTIKARFPSTQSGFSGLVSPFQMRNVIFNVLALKQAVSPI